VRVFLDTNVLLSAFFGSGLCDELFLRLLKTEHTVLVGEPVAREFVRIAKGKFAVAPSDLSFALEVLRQQTPVPAAEGEGADIPNRDDAPIIACALAAKAELFVTGDKALLAMAAVDGMAIVSPRACWERLFKG
jgi:predicted nucleic acid-binding protein